MSDIDCNKEAILNEFQECIRNNSLIKYCPTDENFLMKFLYARKFNVHESHTLLQNYLIAHHKFPQWYKNLTVNDASVQNVIDCGYFVPLLEPDAEGHQIILIRVGKFNPDQSSSNSIARANNILFETMLNTRTYSKNGFIFVFDEGDVTIKHLSALSLIDLKYMVQLFQNATPIHTVGMIFINVPTYVHKIIELIKSTLSDNKTHSQIEVHMDGSVLKTKFDINIFPKEYGGGLMSLQTMVNKFKMQIEEQRNSFMTLDKLEIDATQLNDGDFSTSESDVVESFRDLGID